MNNYESEIEELILDNLSFKYSINNKELLLRYLILRCCCCNKINKKIFEDILLDFILEELCIDILEYKNVKLNKISGFENSLKNIIESLLFRYTSKKILTTNNVFISYRNYIESTLKIINDYTKKHLIGINSPYVTEIRYYYNLTKLNELFDIKEIKSTPKIKGFKYTNKYYEKIELETKYLRYVQAVSFDTNDLTTITEEDFETYLYKHLFEIEEGLRPVSRQFALNDGKVDILAKDKNNVFVILELKTTNDKHLIWQALYYPDAFKEKTGNKEVRMITVCPSYPQFILKPLQKIKNIEMIEYELKIFNSKIENAKFKKIS